MQDDKAPKTGEGATLEGEVSPMNTPTTTLRKRYAHAGGGEEMNAQAFADTLRGLLQLQGRHAGIRVTGLRLVANQPDDVYVNFINLPEGVGKAGGGAEAENNRASFWVRGFGVHGAPSATGKVKVEMANSVFRSKGIAPMRAKTASPSVIAKYLADYINKIVAEVPPHFTHTGQ